MGEATAIAGEVAWSSHDPSSAAVAGARGPAHDAAALPLARGILMERHRVGAPGAARMLAEAAAAAQVPEAALAQALVALLTPSAPEPVASPGPGPDPDLQPRWAVASTAQAWRVLEELPQLRASAVDNMVQAVAQANENGDAAAQLVADLTGAAPDRAVIYAVGEDNALTLVGNVGTPSDVVAAWARLPLVLDIPICASVTQDRAIFLESGEEMEAAYPATRGSREGSQGWVSVPIREGRVVTGVLGLSWTRPVSFDETARARITRAVERAGALMVRSLHGTDREPGLLAGLMQLIPDPWLVLNATGGSDRGALLIEAAASSMRNAADLPGRALHEAFPSLAATGETVADVRQVLRTGRLLVRTVATSRPNGAPWEERPSELRIVRSGRRVVLTWRPFDPSA